jgi:membrane peptidoglycan carboxypeptidase
MGRLGGVLRVVGARLCPPPRILVLILVLLALFAGGGLVAYEAQTSRLQARYFATAAEAMWYWVGPGPSASVRFPQTGPYDHRLGYARLPQMLERLQSMGHVVEAQARTTATLAHLIEAGYSPPYREKVQAGLRIEDRRGEPLFEFVQPQGIYAEFAAVPPIIAEMLLFIENRELLDDTHPSRNPAIEWPRFVRALGAQGTRALGLNHHRPGASTLATQIEKYRHSPHGVTLSPREKFRQMYSASLRAYAAGQDTTAVRRMILVDYLNTVPLSAAPGFGEVNGLAEGLRAWYGADFETVNDVLRRASRDIVAEDLHEQARAVREVLSLMIAQRRPTYLLGPGREQLRALTDTYLRLLAGAGIITTDLRDAALEVELAFARGVAPAQAYVRSEKASNAVRSRLLGYLGTSLLYELDRYDLTVRTTFDAELQDRVKSFLERMQAPGAKRPQAAQLLGRGDSAPLVYSFTLYERGEGVNVVRAQTDNTGQPFDFNEQAKVELGSTAKLRTLAHYLHLMAALYERYAGMSRKELSALEVDRRDRLTRWTIDHLARHPDASLEATLEAAIERRYSASPHEQFFTAGGTHTFSNFSASDNERTPTVREAFRTSINLPFVRLMRDIVQHYVYGSGAGAVLDDAAHPQRAEYLARFADLEGREFLERFYRGYQGMSPEQALEAAAQARRGLPVRLAVLYRSVQPQAPLEAFRVFLAQHGAGALPAGRIEQLYETYAPERYGLHDRGYLARMHPLELWLIAYRAAHPESSFAEVVEAGRQARQDAYEWLHRRSKAAQDSRIRRVLEQEAFRAIHEVWRRHAYPFDALVPSLATSLGVSGDNPAALAELTGIIVNGGMRYRTVRIREFHFAQDTPYESLVMHKPEPGERVMHPAVAALLRASLEDVVERGTARRLRGVYRGSEGPLAIGGKTGTGDNRHRTYGAGGRIIASRSMNRTASFAFFVGERHFGVVSAYVPAPHADRFSFTSSLTVQLLADMARVLEPIVTEGDAH